MADKNKFLEAINNLQITIKERYPKKVLTVQEAASYLGVSTSTLYHMTSRRVIPHSKVKNMRTLYFDRDEITAWALSNKILTREQLTGKAPMQFKK